MAELKSEPPDNVERRLFPRMLVRREAILTLADGEALQGLTRDISREGAYLSVGNCRLRAEPGEHGILLIVLPQATVELQCEVVHAQTHGVGIRLFHGRKDVLGYAITMDLLERASVWEREKADED